jgi:hypothetical protein
MNVVYCFFKLYDNGWYLEKIYAYLEDAQNVLPQAMWEFSDDCKKWYVHGGGGYKIEEREVIYG